MSNLIIPVTCQDPDGGGGVLPIGGIRGCAILEGQF